MEEKKFTEEQLNELLNQATNQNMMLRRNLGQLQEALTYKRIDYLFKMVENFDKFNDEIIAKVCLEIEEFMYPKEEEIKTEE